MSWLFSQALAAECSAGTSLDGEQSAPLSVMPTQHKFWRNDKMMEFSDLSRFGLTCAVLTESHGEELLMSFLEDFPARTFQEQEKAQALKVKGQDYGGKWQESSMRFDPATSSWKTHLCLWEEVLPWSLVTLPRWGLMRNGVVFQHLNAERPMSATEYGSSRKMWATPSASDASRGGRITERMTGTSLAQQVNTPSRHPGCTFHTDSKSGPLNPEWVEWLMGWPVGWTELRPLEMGKFREWLQLHSAS